MSSSSTSLLRNKALWFTVPLVTPILYTIWLNYSISSGTQSTSGPYGSGKLESSSPVPQEVPINDENSLVFHEKVIKPVAKHKFAPEYQKDLDALLTAYLRGNMLIFARLPQAIMIRRLMSDPHDRATFDALHLDSIEFVPGDVVCGVYRVLRREPGRRVELLMDAPESYRGHPFQGMMVIGLVPNAGGDEIVFENEVWMWRKEHEPKVPIESAIRKHLHLFFVKWLMEKQIRQMTQRGRNS